MRDQAGGTSREFLFLQGLAGPFFGMLGKALAARHGVHRVNFHGGDLLYWRLPGAVNYGGRPAGWPAFLEGLLDARGITDIVLFGDCRPMHRAAVAIAVRRGIAVHVFEEGYIRPDWVTLETGGVNGLSSLPRDPGHYLEAAAELPKLPLAPGAVPSSFGRRAREDLAYNFAGMALWPLFPGYRTHRPWHPLVEYAGWGLRLARGKRARRRSAEVLGRLRASGRPYFVFPLQLDCDYQIRVHSPFPGMLPAIERVLGSFAAHAPEPAWIVVKAHPLDNGLKDWRAEVLRVAGRLGVQDRLLFLEEGDIDSLVRGALGLVTVNSTTGTLALAHGVPVATLGQAVYDIPRVTHQGGLDAFWARPDLPEAPVFDALRRVLVERCLIRGGFFSEEGLRLLVEAASARLESAAAAGAHPLRAAASQAGRAGRAALFAGAASGAAS